MITNECVVVMCPPYPEYEEAPKDMSHCELRDCPKCKGKMWLSDKKKGALMFASVLNKDIVLACYDCIKKIAMDNPEGFSNITQVNLS